MTDTITVPSSRVEGDEGGVGRRGLSRRRKRKVGTRPAAVTEVIAWGSGTRGPRRGEERPGVRLESAGPEAAVQGAVSDGFGDMFGADRLSLLQIGDGAGDPEDAIVGAGG